MNFRIDARNLERVFESADEKFWTSATMIAEEGAKMFEGYAKEHRPWRDRTGHARQRLIGFAEQNRAAEKIKVNIAHGVYYGVFLEYAHEKRYAILQPTVDKVSDRVLEMYKGFLSKVLR